MKASDAVTSIDELCRLLRRSRLLTAEEITSLVQRWRSESGGKSSLEEFSRWLVAGRLVTDYQMTTLLQGHADHFFLGGYKLLDRIGKGSQTRVYKGIDRVGRLAAIKILPPSRARNAQVLARFYREARVGQRLDHANVVRILGAGEEGGLHHLILEYLEGETLQQVLASQGRLSPRVVADLALQVLEGLQHMHDRKVIHRDLQPANLMLIRPAAGGRPGEGLGLSLVKILGLSLSRVEAEEDPIPADLDLSRPPGEGLTLPSLVYLAPELARRPQAADTRSDLYSLACVLYHTLAGQPPFTDPTPERLIRRHATESPRPLRGLNNEVPDDLARIVARMMARDPVDRFTDPAEAAEAVQAFQAGTATTAVPMVQVEQVEWPAEPVPAPPVPAPPLPPPVAPFADDLSFPASPFEMDAAAEEFPIAVSSPSKRQPIGNLALDRRDWLLLVAGAGGLLLLQVLAWVVGRVIAVLRGGSKTGGEE